MDPAAPSAVVMVGGQGARLGTLTDRVPKPLLPVGERPILEWILLHLAFEGFKEIVLATGFRADAIRAHVGDGSRWGVHVTYTDESTPLGTAGALAMVAPRVEGPVLVMNGDIMTDISFRDMVDFHVRRGAALTLGMVRHAQTVPFGMITREEDRLTGIVEKPSLHVDVGAGIYVVSPEVLALVPSRQRIDFPDLIQRLLGTGATALCYPVTGSWRDIGRMEDYQAVNQDAALLARMRRWEPGSPA